MSTTTKLDELAGQVAELQRERDLKERGLDGIPRGREYTEEIARRQSHAFLIGRERAQRGFDARQRAEQKLKTNATRAEADLAKIDRERAARLEQHEATRRDILGHFATLEEKPKSALTAIRAEVDQAGADAEAAPVDIAVPKVRVGRDDSDLHQSTSSWARTLGSMPDRGRAMTGAMGGSR